MENTNPTMPPPPQGNPYQQQANPYQQAPGGYQGHNQVGMQTDAPGAGAALVCGIIGLVLMFGLIGVILNIIAIVNGSKAINAYQANPGRYTDASFRKAKSGRVCGIIGLSVGIPLSIIILAAVS